MSSDTMKYAIPRFRRVIFSENIRLFTTFGGIIGDISTNPGAQPYKFGGKEYEHYGEIDLYDFGARLYNPALCVWISTDPLAEKYYGTSHHAYCMNNPINIIDHNGKEGVKYIDENGNKHIEANVIVLQRNKIEIKDSYSQKKKERIRKKNERIERKNEERVQMTKKALDEVYGGENGVINSKGEKVIFTFNVKGLKVDDYRLEKISTANHIAAQYGIAAITPNKYIESFDYGVALAVVVSQASSRGYLGLATGQLVRASDTNDFSTTLGHEVGHTFGLKDHDSSSWFGGGLMNYPAGNLTGEEVDEIWEKAYFKE